jgi:hypothetical protein
MSHRGVNHRQHVGFNNLAHTIPMAVPKTQRRDQAFRAGGDGVAISAEPRLLRVPPTSSSAEPHQNEPPTDGLGRVPAISVSQAHCAGEGGRPAGGGSDHSPSRPLTWMLNSVHCGLAVTACGDLGRVGNRFSGHREAQEKQLMTAQIFQFDQRFFGRLP